MIKKAYQFQTIGPLHTGSDEVAGVTKTLRRQKCVLAEPVKYNSRLTEEQRRDVVIQIALGVWYAIDFDQIKGPRLMKIYDEFANKLKAAARAESKHRFLENLCSSWGIKSLQNKNVYSCINLIDDRELLDTIRNETIYIVLSIRVMKEKAKERQKETGILSFDFDFPAIKAGETIKTARTEDEIPCISGNSIRGKMRRLIMHDFCRRTGIKTLKKRAYHTLFTGGFLDQSTRNEDLKKMEMFIEKCPALGLLGAAIGNMTIEGEMKVGWAYPLCIERGTGEKSYWQCLDSVFQTRLDSSKTENDIKITGSEEKAQQMKYEYEVFADGTRFEHRIACTASDPLIMSAFWHILELFEAAPFLGGMGSVGNGEISLDWKLEGNGKEYTEYLEKNKEEINEFWENITI